MSERVENFQRAGQILAVFYGCSCEDFHFVNRVLRSNGTRGHWFCFRRADEGVSRELQDLYYVSEDGAIEKNSVTLKGKDQQKAG